MDEIASLDNTSLGDQKDAGTQIARAAIEAGYFGKIGGDTDIQSSLSKYLFSQSGSVTGVMGLAMASGAVYNDLSAPPSGIKNSMNFQWLKTSAPFLLMALTLLVLFVAIKVLPAGTSQDLLRYVTYFKY